jgi:hypothetical protein
VSWPESFVIAFGIALRITRRGLHERRILATNAAYSVNAASFLASLEGFTIAKLATVNGDNIALLVVNLAEANVLTKRAYERCLITERGPLNLGVIESSVVGCHSLFGIPLFGCHDCFSLLDLLPV